MAFIRDLASIVTKWANRTPQSVPEYIAGVAQPRVPWAEASVKASDNWKAGVTQAVQQGRFAKGVTRVGDQKWARNTQTKGPGRFAEGVQLGQADYSTGFAPYRDAIQNVQLPPRFARRDPRNLERVKAIDQALIATKDRIG